MGLDNGLYIIRPKTSNDVLVIGPVPLPYPPVDVPVRIGNGPVIERWLVRDSKDNTVNVFSGRGRDNDYKWVVKDDDLFVSAGASPHDFRFEAAGGKFYTIGLLNGDFLLTVDKDAFPQCTFKPADGSDAQRFEAIRIDRA